MSLSDTACKNAKPGEKPRKMFDGQGLFLLVTPKGGKWWRLKYRFGGKEKLLSLGTYPNTSLAQARERRDEARKQVAEGLDPSTVRKAGEAEARAHSETFHALADEWYSKFKHTFAESYRADVWQRLAKDVLPWIGHRPVRELTPPEILSVVRRIESRGAAETARRQLQKIGQIMRYAVATGRAERDPTQDLRGAVATPEKRHFPALTDSFDVARLLKAIDGYQGSHVVRCALRFAPLVFVRPGNLRHAEWSEIDLKGPHPAWKIPAQKMKMRRPHVIPLSRQAIEILNELHPLTGEGKYLFPGNRPGKLMSENTLNAALRTLGFEKGTMTAHGFRAMASTLLNETGWPPDVIEAQLAHAPKNAIRAAYNRSQYLPQRRELMQSWADFLDKLKASDGGKVLPMFRTGTGS